MSRKRKDNLVKGAIYASAGFTVFILIAIIGFILIKGLPGISLNFLTRNYEKETTYVTIPAVSSMNTEDLKEGYMDSLGITLEKSDDKGWVIADIEKDSLCKQSLNLKGEIYRIKKKDIILSISPLNETTLKLKVVRPGGGIVPMIVTTFYMIILSLLIAAPVGILSAIYLIEYAKPGKLKHIIHFAIENLAGIPSIIYGLFGSLFFVKLCHMKYSLLSGALTLSIILLPMIITTTVEALKAIPKSYRESSLGLGATKLQTISKVILPNALSGILVAILLGIGRIVGESAALLLTAGTAAQIPKALYGNAAGGATLTIKMYTLMKEENDLTTACAIGIVLLAIIIILNFASKAITKKLLSRRGA